MTKTIPFGELMLTKAQINKMGKLLWDDPQTPPWNDLHYEEQQDFIREFILKIPKTLGVIGLKVAEKMMIHLVKICDYEGCTTIASFSTLEAAQQMVDDMSDGYVRRDLVIEKAGEDLDAYIDRQYVWEVYKGWSADSLDVVSSKDRNDHDIDKVMGDLVYVVATTAREAVTKGKELFKQAKAKGRKKIK